MYRLWALTTSSYTTVHISVLKCRCVWFPVSPCIFCLLTATLSTRAASPPSTTKTCTTTRTSGTCKSLAAHSLTCSLLRFVVLPCTVLFIIKLDHVPRGTLVPQNHCGKKIQADGAARISFIMQTTKPAARASLVCALSWGESKWKENIKFSVWDPPSQHHKHCTTQVQSFKGL